jgi:hypothetical protein
MGDPSAAEYFKTALALFEQNDISRKPSAQVANWHQAVSHAYSGLGAFDKARNALNEALKWAERLSENRRVFSSVQYKEIPAKEFIEETSRLLEGIEEKLRQAD